VLLDNPSHRPDGFSLDAYIASGAFGFGGEETIKLEAIFRDHSGDHLCETPLGADQELFQIDDGCIRLAATVVNTEQLRWWLLGFGGHVEVLSPPTLRETMAKSARELYSLYQDK